MQGERESYRDGDRQLANYALPVIVSVPSLSLSALPYSSDCFAKSRNVVVNISAARKGVAVVFVVVGAHIIRMANNCARRICCEIIMKHLQFAHGKRFTFSFSFLYSTKGDWKDVMQYVVSGPLSSVSYIRYTYLNLSGLEQANYVPHSQYPQWLLLIHVFS